MIMMNDVRNTIQHKIVYETVLKMHNHPSAEEIYQTIKKEFPHISMGTVYRNLNRLARNGLIQRVELPNDADRFDYQTHKHHHLKCHKCNGIFDIDINIDKDISDYLITNGHKIESYQLVFNGICNNCLNKRKDYM